MKTNIELAREAGGTAYTNRHVDGSAFAFGPEALDRFAAAVEARMMERLLGGAGEPARIEQELYGDEFRYYTSDQTAAAVLREREECAITAWNALMAIAKRLKINPSELRGFEAVSAIRNRGTK